MYDVGYLVLGAWSVLWVVLFTHPVGSATHKAASGVAMCLCEMTRLRALPEPVTSREPYLSRLWCLVFDVGRPSPAWRCACGVCSGFIAYTSAVRGLESGVQDCGVG